MKDSPFGKGFDSEVFLERRAESILLWFRASWKIKVAAELAGSSSDEEACSAFTELLEDAAAKGTHWTLLAKNRDFLERVADRVYGRHRRRYSQVKKWRERILACAESTLDYVEPSFPFEVADAMEAYAEQVRLKPLQKKFFALYFVAEIKEPATLAPLLDMTVEGIYRLKCEVLKALKNPQNVALAKRTLGIH